MGDRPVFTEFACFQLAARIAIGSCDPPISRYCARRRLDPLAAIFKGAERIRALNGKLDAYGVFHYSSNLRQMEGFRVYVDPGYQQDRPHYFGCTATIVTRTNIGGTNGSGEAVL